MVENKIRDSNFEMLRILAMFLIVFLHTGTHGISTHIVIKENMSELTTMLYYIFRSLAIVSVPVYILISGYYLSTSNFKISKVIRLFTEVTFFSIVMYFMYVLTTGTFNFVDLLISLFTVLFGQYWFATVYLVLYLLSPFLNKLLSVIPKDKHLKLIIVLTFISCIWQFLDTEMLLNGFDGKSVGYFTLLYLIGAYIRRYGYIIKDLSKPLYLLTFFILSVINSLGYIILDIDRVFAYNFPLVLLASYSLFMFFNKVELKSANINYIAKYVFGIYLIHDNVYIKDVLWNQFGIVEKIIYPISNIMVLKMLGFSIVLFIVCWFVSVLISNIFSIFYKTIQLQIDKAAE